MAKYSSIDQLPSKLNIRDLGGLPAKDGRRVKKGLLFRSSALSFFDKDELEPVRKLGLKTILDLRAASGVEKSPDPVIEGATYYNYCAAFENILDDLNSPLDLASLLFDEDQQGNVIEVLVSSYTASLAFSNDAYRFLFECLIKGEVPLLFHCSNGKDRTGVAAMLILLALGVDAQTVTDDYLQSNNNRRLAIEDLKERFQAVSGISTNVTSFLTMIEGVLPESADMMISEILEKYGTYENYMEQEYGFDEKTLNKFRDLYLEDA